MKRFKCGAYVDVPSKTYTFNNCKLNCNGFEMNCRMSFERECPPDYTWLEDLINNQGLEVTATFDDFSHFEKGKAIKHSDKLLQLFKKELS